MNCRIGPLCFAISIPFLFGQAIAQPNPVPNPSFENWRDTIEAPPIGWRDSLQGIPISCFGRSRNAHTGSFAVSGYSTQEGIGEEQPPILMSKFPLNFSPANFEGWYLFGAGSGDVLRFTLKLRSKGRTVDSVTMSDGPATTLYKHFVVPVIRTTSDVLDSAIIIIRIANDTSARPPQGMFTLDDLALTAPAGPPEIQYVDLAGGTKLVATASTFIRWVISGALTNPIDVDVSFDQKQTWLPVQHGLDTSVRSLAWSVPDTMISNAIVRVQSGTVTGYSSLFEISPQIQSVHLPASKLLPNSTTIVQWNVSGTLVSPIDLDISFDQEQSWKAVQHGLEDTVRSYLITVPDTIVAGAILRVQSGNVAGYSAPFTITTAAVLHTQIAKPLTVSYYPFPNQTVITYGLEQSADVQLFIYDVLGRCVLHHVEGWQAAGVHILNLDEVGTASSPYEIVLLAGNAYYYGRWASVR